MQRAPHLVLAPLLLAAALAPTVASADDTRDLVPWSQRHAFDRAFGVGVHVAGRAGYAEALGGGARLRWEPLRLLGVDVFAEGFSVRDPDQRRVDIPIGFDLAVPIRLGRHLRLRPLAGMCAVFSFRNPQREGVQATHDIHFGVHGGLGLELALGRFVSLGLDVRGILYFGHETHDGGWSSHVGDRLTTFGIAQANLGVMVRL
ncbi:MAG: hypothetical protein KF901_06125 [Myxococcales bacterium]|nr:hypothetical protein [Myxococcales bacterium]